MTEESNSTPKFDYLWHLILRHTILVLVVISVIASGIILLHGAYTSRDLVESTALQDAKLYSSSITEFRALYTSEVVQTINEHNQKLHKNTFPEESIVVTHDYQNHAYAIPLPATLGILLGKRIGDKGSGAETHIYSAYPFPYRGRKKLSERDNFQQKAWQALSMNPDKPFYRFDVYGGRQVLRYATADLMRPACVDCHNTHDDSPRDDWQVNDVRGVLEVVLPMDDVEEVISVGLRDTLILLVLMTVSGVGILAIVIGRLKRTSTELEEQIDEVNQREGEILSMNKELTVARDEALAASHAKSRFLATMGHELRTPLHAILGYSDLLSEEAAETGQQDMLSDLDRINLAGKNLLYLISEILDLSNVETGKMELLSEPFEVADLINEVTSAVQSQIEENDNHLEVNSGEAIGTIIADRVRVRQVLINLLSNAGKFTNDGKITLTVKRQYVDSRDWLLFSVNDTGIGIAKDQLCSIFEAFSQVDDSFSRQYEGAGLGLAICKRLCELMGGEIEAESELGTGSTFTVRLPVEREQ